MPDKKLTDSEIVKALEWCEQFENNIVSVWKSEAKYILALKTMQTINNVLKDYNRLQAENKKFKDRQKPTGASGYKVEKGKIVFFTNMLGGCRYEYKDLEEVVKTLNELLHEAYSKNEIVFALKCKTEELKTAKAEAYKEFAERLKEKYKPYVILGSGVAEIEIDNLLKEMLGDK